MHRHVDVGIIHFRSLHLVQPLITLCILFTRLTPSSTATRPFSLPERCAFSVAGDDKSSESARLFTSAGQRCIQHAQLPLRAVNSRSC